MAPGSRFTSAALACSLLLGTPHIRAQDTQAAPAQGTPPAATVRPFTPVAWVLVLTRRGYGDKVAVVQKADLACTSRQYERYRDQKVGRLVYPTLPWDWAGYFGDADFQMTPLEQIVNVRPATAGELAALVGKSRPQEGFVVEMADGSPPRFSRNSYPVCHFVKGSGWELATADGALDPGQTLQRLGSFTAYDVKGFEKYQSDASRMQDQAASAEAARLDAFRKGLKPGDSTSCGLVVEVKPALVQIQKPDLLVWVRRDSVNPPGMRCLS